MQNLSLLTDLYQLTMLAGYHGSGKLAQQSCFELYFRKLPFQGGFCVAAGLETALEYLTSLRFEDEQIDYLRSLGLFSGSFLTWLKGFRFSGDVEAVQEGELIFPGEPLLRVIAPLPEAQLVESALLNIVNFQTLIATKAARVYVASQEGTVLEFGLRRAQGIDGALSASRAAYLGGCSATSNTMAGHLYDIPIKGTHAHSWIMSFPTELEAFRTYARLYPDNCTLLVDTYDTLESGVPNAITVAEELAREGHRLAGIRLDSGDLCALSVQSRKMLDEAGFEDAKIVASNDLDEHLVANLLSQGARIDIWGVGTNLVTAKDEPALGGVYKLVAAQGDGQDLEPRIKISANPVKTTVPGVKQIYRGYDAGGHPRGDVLCLDAESAPAGPTPSHHTHFGHHSRTLKELTFEPLLKPVLRDGRRTEESAPAPLSQLRERCLDRLSRLPSAHKRRSNPHLYWVGLSQELWELRNAMIDDAERA